MDASSIWITGQENNNNNKRLIKIFLIKRLHCISYKLAVIRWISSRDVMYSMVTVVNNTILATWKLLRDFPGGTVVKSLPADAGDTGSILGPGRSPMPGATKPVHHNYWASTLEPTIHNYWAHALQQEKPPQWEAHTPPRRVAPACHN